MNQPLVWLIRSSHAFGVDEQRMAGRAQPSLAISRRCKQLGDVIEGVRAGLVAVHELTLSAELMQELHTKGVGEQGPGPDSPLDRGAPDQSLPYQLTNVSRATVQRPCSLVGRVQVSSQLPWSSPE
jgi:hypothetical protein